MSPAVISAIISAIATGVTTAMVALLVKAVTGVRQDIRRFMAEHLYLLRVADWTKINLGSLFDHLNLTPSEPPPRLPDKDIRL